jgi:DNA-binding MarR family transcriptional regulator
MSAALQTVEDIDVATPREALLTKYMDTLSYIERLHRLLLDVIKDEFERLNVIDVTSVQALLLFNIGDNEVTAGELKSRGYYQGSNVSYNLKKLVEGGYISHERCSIDRRAVRIKLTDSGIKVRRIVNELWISHVDGFLENDTMSFAELQEMESSMRSLERFWTDRIRYIY